jgi:hypothetical protein
MFNINKKQANLLEHILCRQTSSRKRRIDARPSVSSRRRRTSNGRDDCEESLELKKYIFKSI